MASKVMLNIQFAQLGKSSANSSNATNELVTAPRDSDFPKGNEETRVLQLEQNLRFLQEQHTQMLSGLHKEIDNLRHKNRELQFQLVFSKGAIPVSSPSSPEDDLKPKAAAYSPKTINPTPLQVEILEKELGELKLQAQEIDSRNAYLSAIVDEQKKKLERYERDHEREIERASQPDPVLLRKLDDADALIGRLRKQNTELRQGNEPKDNGNFYRGTTSQNHRNNGGRHRGNSAGHYRGNWFPPLNAQTYWHNGQKTGNERNGETEPLPSLSNGYYKRGSNNNYRRGEGRVFRSGGPRLS